MRKISEVLRLRFELRLGQRAIAALVRLARAPFMNTSAVWFAYTPDRKGEHPKEHLSKFMGTLQADGYAGFDQVYETGRIQEAACWAVPRQNAKCL